jgi:hypothetical protein
MASILFLMQNMFYRYKIPHLKPYSQVQLPSQPLLQNHQMHVVVDHFRQSVQVSVIIHKGRCVETYNLLPLSLICAPYPHNNWQSHLQFLKSK